VTPDHPTTNTNRAVWVDLAEFPVEGSAYLRQAFGSCRPKDDRTPKGCQIAPCQCGRVTRRRIDSIPSSISSRVGAK